MSIVVGAPGGRSATAEVPECLALRLRLLLLLPLRLRRHQERAQFAPTSNWATKLVHHCSLPLEQRARALTECRTTPASAQISSAEREDIQLFSHLFPPGTCQRQQQLMISLPTEGTRRRANRERPTRPKLTSAFRSLQMDRFLPLAPIGWAENPRRTNGGGVHQRTRAHLFRRLGRSQLAAVRADAYPAGSAAADAP